MPKHNEVSPRAAQMCSVITHVLRMHRSSLKSWLLGLASVADSKQNCQFFCLSPVNPLVFVWYSWKQYGDEPLTDSFVSQSNEHPFQKSRGSLIWCSLIQQNDTLLHLLTHFDRLACQTVPRPWREYKTHTGSQALWHLKEACVWAFERVFEGIQCINKSAKQSWPCALSKSNKPAYNKSLRNWTSSKITPIY